MAPKAAGADFVKSLEGIFEELQTKGYQTRNDIQEVASQIIKLILACGRMTSAKARSSCPVLLPDGSVPDSIILFPPSKFNLQEAVQKQLRQVSSGSGFIKILKEAFEREFAPKPKQTRRTGKARAAAKKNARQRTPLLAVPAPVTSPTPLRLTTPTKTEQEAVQPPAPAPRGVQDLTGDSDVESLDGPMKAEPGIRLDVDFDAPEEADQSDEMGVDSDDETEDFAMDKGREELRAIVLEGIHLAVSAGRNPESEGFEDQKAEVTAALVRLNINFERFGPLFTQEPYQRLDVDLEKKFVEKMDGVSEAAWEDFKESLLDALARLEANMETPRPTDFTGDPSHPRRRFLDMTPYILERLFRSPIKHDVTILRMIDRMCGWRKVRKLNFEARFTLFTDMAYSYELNVAALHRRWDSIKYLTELCAQIAREVGPEREVVTEAQVKRVRRARLRQVKRLMNVYEDMHEVDVVVIPRYEGRIDRTSTIRDQLDSLDWPGRCEV